MYVHPTTKSLVLMRFSLFSRQLLYLASLCLHSWFQRGKKRHSGILCVPGQGSVEYKSEGRERMGGWEHETYWKAEYFGKPPAVQW